MTIVSQLELPGSPVEQASWSKQTYFWDPTNELASGETISNPTCTAMEYDPAFAANVADYKDVTATVIQAGSPTIGTGTHAGQVQIVVAANALRPGYEYQIRLSVFGVLGSTPARYFRIRCKV